jgi:hypothetical protein
MATPTERLTELRMDLLEIERQQNDYTLSHSDQQLLDQAWEDLTTEIEELEQSLLTWHDAAEYLEEEEEEEQVTMARAPPAETDEHWGPGPEVLQIAVPPPVEDEEEYPEYMDDCRCCSGCMYCRDSPGYDGADEV